MKYLVITSYPKQGQIHGTGVAGIASYTKNTLLAMQKADPEIEFEIYAERFASEDIYKEENMIVKRSWKRGSFASLIELCMNVRKNPVRDLLVPIEAYMYGGALHLLLFCLILLVWKFSGKQITFILHQVVLDFAPFVKNRPIQFFLKTVAWMYYTYLVIIASAVVVFEERFKDLLGRSNKITVIPHAVEPVKKISKTAARRRLKLKKNGLYVLDFGFISPYKGADLVVNAWEEKRATRLILAGGPNPNHNEKKEYRSYVRRVLNQAANKKNVLATGFLAEKDLPLYFSACDVVILPYRLFMSSSGPLSLAFAYGKPVLLSQPLEGYFETRDFKRTLAKSPLAKKDFLFSWKQGELANKLAFIQKHYRPFKAFALEMNNMRSWNKIAHSYLQVLTS